MTDKENLQDIFNKVATHLLTQKKRSVDRDGASCKYRGVDGLKCAVGCLIPDEKYHPGIEGQNVLTLPVKEAIRGIGLGGRAIQFLSALQSTHDCFSVDEWLQQLRDVANVYELDTSVLKTFGVS